MVHRENSKANKNVSEWNRLHSPVRQAFVWSISYYGLFVTRRCFTSSSFQLCFRVHQ